jgi:serine/threonine-protein kinase
MMSADDRHTQEEWDRLKSCFAQALEIPAEDRPAFLDLCSIDSSTRAQLLEMLEDYEEADRLFARLSTEVRSFSVEKQLVDPGETLCDRFLIWKFLARGGMGEVYEVEDLELGGRLALKVMRKGVAAYPGSLQRFREEIRLARAVSSPHVCRVFDVARQNDSTRDLIFFTMELLHGETLSDRILRCGTFGVEEARPVVRQLAMGLQAAHACGVVHRDLKSSNVMICPGTVEERVVITDFGLSLPLEAEGLVGELVDGATHAYAPPERSDGKDNTVTGDIFSLGVVLYEMMTGTLPQASGSSPPPSPRQLRSNLPAAWEAVILRCLENDPAKRYGRVIDIAHALQCFPAEKTTRRMFWLTAAATAASAGLVWRAKWPSAHPSPERSLAVLPFVADTPLKYLADGLADRLYDSLGQLPGLRVIARSASERAGEASRAGQQLDVAYILAGSVNAQDTQLRIHLELSTAGNRSRVWSNTYEITNEQIAAIPAQAVRSLIRVMALEPQSTAMSSAPDSNANAAAYQLYLLGRFHASKRDPASLHESVACLERSVKLDPHFGAAYASLGFSYQQLAFIDRLTAADSIARAKQAAATAAALDPNCADAYFVVALVQQWWDWDWKGAEANYKRALSVNPNLAPAHHWYARLLYPQQRFAEALSEIQTAGKLDPLDRTLRVAKGMILTYARDLPNAIKELRLLAAEDPGYGYVYVPLSCALEAAGRYLEALAAAFRGVELTDRASFALSQLGHLCALTGRDGEARALLDELDRMYHHGTASPAEIAAIYVGWKDRESSLHWLELGLPVRDMVLTILPVDSQFDFLRDEPRFKNLMSRVYPKLF